MRIVLTLAMAAGLAAMPFEANARGKFRMPATKAAPSSSPASPTTTAKAAPDKPDAGVSAQTSSGSSRTTVIVVPRIGRGSSSSEQTEDRRNAGQGQEQVFKAGMRPFVAPAQTASAAEEQAKAAATVRAPVPVLGAANVERVAVPSFQKLN